MSIDNITAAKDTGVAITSENIPTLFDLTFTPKPKGIGLGLALSKKLVEANQDRIEVESKPGKSSTFIVCLRASKDLE